MLTRGEDFLGKVVEVVVDRPLGSRHPQYPDLLYEANYGHIPDTLSPDGEELDAYILGVNFPLEKFAGTCIALLKRKADDDDKLIVAPDGVRLTEVEIRRLVNFQEKFFESTLRLA